MNSSKQLRRDILIFILPLIWSVSIESIKRSTKITVDGPYECFNRIFILNKPPTKEIIYKKYIIKQSSRTTEKLTFISNYTECIPSLLNCHDLRDFKKIVKLFTQNFPYYLASFIFFFAVLNTFKQKKIF